MADWVPEIVFYVGLRNHPKNDFRQVEHEQGFSSLKEKFLKSYRSSVNKNHLERNISNNVRDFKTKYNIKSLQKFLK